jgi:hypothetical protein
MLPSFSPPHAFLQADKAVAADDEVIDKLDIEHFACLNELPGHGNVLGRRSGIAAGVEKFMFVL